MQSVSVLIVEDEVLVALMLEEVLLDAGLSVAGIERSAERALDRLKIDPRPDLLLVDVVLLGDLSGIDLAEGARQFWSGPIVFHTSASDGASVKTMAGIPNASIVFKPAAVSDLVQTIHQMIGV